MLKKKIIGKIPYNSVGTGADGGSDISFATEEEIRSLFSASKNQAD